MSPTSPTTPAEEMRRRIMAKFAERPDEQLTAGLLSDELGEPFSRVAYGLLVLKGAGELEEVEADSGHVGRVYRLPTRS